MNLDDFIEKTEGIFISPEELKKEIFFDEKDLGKLQDLYKCLLETRNSIQKASVCFNDVRKRQGDYIIKLWGNISFYLAGEYGKLISKCGKHSLPSYGEFFGRALGCNETKFTPFWKGNLYIPNRTIIDQINTKKSFIKKKIRREKETKH